MKSKFFILGCLALMVAGIFYSCKKDHAGSNDPDSNRDAQITESQEVNNLMLQFNQGFEDFKSGKHLKSAVRINIDSVIWYIDAAINFNYASGVYSFERLHRDTVYVEVQLDSDMKALLADVFESYDKAQIRVGGKYYATPGENKKFVMATVSDAGSIAGGKRKLSIATLTGTGKATISEDFGNDESFHFDRLADYNCKNEEVNGAPLVFEAKLLDHLNTEAPNGCRYVFIGKAVEVTYEYSGYRIDENVPLTNYLDYKIFAAHESVTAFNDDILCLEYDQWGLGMHEMQFYYDYLKDFVLMNVPYRKSFAYAVILSPVTGPSQNRTICHEPTFYYRTKLISCEQSNPNFPTD